MAGVLLMRSYERRLKKKMYSVLQSQSVRSGFDAGIQHTFWIYIGCSYATVDRVLATMDRLVLVVHYCSIRELTGNNMNFFDSITYLVPAAAFDLKSPAKPGIAGMMMMILNFRCSFAARSTASTIASPMVLSTGCCSLPVAVTRVIY